MSEETEKQSAQLRLDRASNTGLESSFGNIREDTIKQLKGSKKVKNLRQMSRFDHTTHAGLTLIKKMIRNVKWEVQEGDEEGREFLRSVLGDMEFSFKDTIINASSFLDYGWSLQEIVYKRREGKTGNKRTDSKFEDGRIGWRKFAPIGPETIHQWIYDDEDDQLIGISQDVFAFSDKGIDAEPIPMSKLLHYRTQIGLNNPEGRSILEGAYRAYIIKKHIEDVESTGIERGLNGYPVMEVPIEIIKAAEDETKNIRDKLLKTISNIRRDEHEGMLFPKEMDENGNDRYNFRLMHENAAQGFDLSRTISRYDARILNTMLADFVLGGIQKEGGATIQQSKIDLFLTALNSYVDIISDVLNEQAIPRLWRLNGMDPFESPKIVPTDVRTASVRDIARLLRNMAQSGAEMFPDEDLESQLLERIGLTPDKEEDSVNEEQSQSDNEDEEQNATT